MTIKDYQEAAERITYTMIEVKDIANDMRVPLGLPKVPFTDRELKFIFDSAIEPISLEPVFERIREALRMFSQAGLSIEDLRRIPSTYREVMDTCYDFTGGVHIGIDPGGPMQVIKTEPFGGMSSPIECSGCAIFETVKEEPYLTIIDSVRKI